VAVLARNEPSRPRGAGARATNRAGPAPLPLPGRTPPHPGQFLESRFLVPLRISQTDLATALGVSRRRVNELINGKRGITPDTAVRLALFFRNDAAFWMHLQVAWDMRNAVRSVRGSGTVQAKRR
jgi:addiction module HigA family antidote